MANRSHNKIRLCSRVIAEPSAMDSIRRYIAQSVLEAETQDLQEAA